MNAAKSGDGIRNPSPVVFHDQMAMAANTHKAAVSVARALYLDKDFTPTMGIRIIDFMEMDFRYI